MECVPCAQFHATSLTEDTGRWNRCWDHGTNSTIEKTGADGARRCPETLDQEKTWGCQIAKNKGCHSECKTSSTHIVHIVYI